jgi:SsrA-binding protein
MKDKVYIQNRKASFDYFFLQEFTAGIQLQGSEVKQIRRGKVSLVDSYCYFQDGELFVKGLKISSNEEAFSHDPDRVKKLLLKKNELKKLERDLDEGMTIVVKSIFSTERGLLKINIALSKGKKNFDKRASIKDKESRREMRDFSPGN